MTDSTPVFITHCPFCNGHVFRQTLDHDLRHFYCDNCAYTANLLAYDPKLKCPDCGAGMIVKHGKFGPFWSCVAFPKCHGTRKPLGTWHLPALDEEESCDR